ncbi:GNAT family N-acetyltransferase [Streptacidiphilus neutrinimicus]|uniref:GNAT family N-acetyltransferase n=1 Tax=Streptacidiphilus neutrinimicus TaxID=105420 RepID=UPI0005AABE1E|nr:GNAT family N-acetyltransferase [Streptacidiphilus neutrinimicus]
MISTRDDGLRLDTDPSRIDVDRVHHWLSTDAFWALDRSRETVARSIENSLVFGVYAARTAGDDENGGGSGGAEGPEGAEGGGHGEQLAFARVVTDYATFGWLCDVYVAREARGRGIGTWLAESVVAELAPFRLKRLMLATVDAHEVYARAGFQPIPAPERLMIVFGADAGPAVGHAPAGSPATGGRRGSA